MKEGYEKELPKAPLDPGEFSFLGPVGVPTRGLPAHELPSAAHAMLRVNTGLAPAVCARTLALAGRSRGVDLLLIPPFPGISI